MPLVDVVNISNEKVGEVELPDRIYDAPIKPHLVHEVVTAQLNSRRAGTACTKGRGEMAYSTRKPYRQKKTGRARAGSRRSPLWRGGGTIFGPKPRDFGWRPPAAIRRSALCVVLTAKLQDKELLILDDFPMAEAKTKNFVGIVGGLSKRRTLVVTPSEIPAVELASRNAADHKVLRVDGLNCYDLLRYEQVVILKGSLPAIEERLLKSNHRDFRYLDDLGPADASAEAAPSGSSPESSPEADQPAADNEETR
ncbi:MAG: 50S ribosomal protein L4 [Deltaproteobacteria bacterium]|jgi:large subunit ribosomal protein L4|nr:50S ribosomal protein L4 [Deltaproteobacteria bacterium]